MYFDDTDWVWHADLFMVSVSGGQKDRQVGMAWNYFIKVTGVDVCTDSLVYLTTIYGTTCRCDFMWYM